MAYKEYIIGNTAAFLSGIFTPIVPVKITNGISA
jgi:hypothetical protein